MDRRSRCRARPDVFGEHSAIDAVEQHDVEMPNVAGGICAVGSCRPGTSASSSWYSRSVTPARRVPLVEMRQLHVEHRALDAFHSGVVTDFDVIVPAVLSVVAEAADAGGDGVVIGDDRAGFAKGAEVLAGVEAEAADAADRADAAALMLGAVSLGGILDQRKAVSIGDLR